MAEIDETTRQQRALELYEKGAAAESTGLMRDAIMNYQSAIRLHHDVEKLYRTKVQNEYQQELSERTVVQKLKVLTIGKREPTEGDSGVGGVPKEEVMEVEEVEPCWLLDVLTDDILIEICTILSHIDPRAHVAFSASCRRVSQVAFHSLVYREMCRQIYPRQVYSSSAVQLNGITVDQEQMVRNWDFHWASMMDDRPFVKYQGVYIAKVTYISEGARSFRLNNVIKLVTYFRYVRFYPDGVVIKLTTTDEPSMVVPYFHRENVAQFRMALVARFTIEMDGHVTLRRQTPEYEFVEELEITSLGDRKYHRLQWISSGTINKEGERSYFNMSKEKPFNFSGVLSYHVD